MTRAEIEDLANRPGALTSAVVKFLSALDPELGLEESALSLAREARAAGWTEPTIAAIGEGIRRTFQRPAGAPSQSGDDSARSPARRPLGTGPTSRRRRPHPYRR